MTSIMDRPQTAALPALKAGGKVLRTSPDRMGRLVPSDPASALPALKAQFYEQGYLWLKGLLARDEVLDFRGYVFSAFADVGLVAPGSDPRLGLAAEGDAPRDLVNRRLMELVRSAAFESFCVQPRLWRFMDGFLGGLSYLHKRKILRHTMPGSEAVTPAHYDLVYLRGGTDRIVTAWIPIGDTPVEMGGLVYLEGSHTEGTKLEAAFREKNAELTPGRAHQRLQQEHDRGRLDQQRPAGHGGAVRYALADRRLRGGRRGAPQPLHDPRLDRERRIGRTASGSRPISATRTSGTRSTRGGPTTGRSTTCSSGRSFRWLSRIASTSRKPWQKS